MSKFAWEGVDRMGTVRKGVMEAADVDAVANRLRADQITPKRIKSASIGNIELKFGTGVTSRDIQIFTRQLATMIDAGLPLVQCLDILANQVENKSFGNILFSVKRNVEAGMSFSDSLRRHPKVFDTLFVNLVHAGEIGGILDTILNRLAAYIEKSVKLKAQVKSALMYPTVISVVAMASVVVILTWVIPTFEQMYEEFGGALPAPTQFVINLSNSFLEYKFFYLGGLLGFIVFISMVLSNDRGRDVFDAMVLKLPVVGSIIRKVVVARFTRTLGTLLSSGVPILDSLEICGKTSGNRAVERAINHARKRVTEGKDLASPLGDTNVFPHMVVQMIGVGEQTGAMDQMLQKIADFYEDEVDTAVSGLTSLLEPIIMAFLGIVVGGLIVAMYLPVFDMASHIEGG